MPQTRNTVTLHGTPLRIWSALVDRDQRRAWGPLIELDATDRLGKTESSFVVNSWSRPIRTPASVDRLYKPRCSLGFGLMALLYLVTDELLVEAHEKPDSPLISAMFFIGFLALLTLEEIMG